MTVIIWACKGFDWVQKAYSRGQATAIGATQKVNDNNRYAAPVAA